MATPSSDPAAAPKGEAAAAPVAGDGVFSATTFVENTDSGSAQQADERYPGGTAVSGSTAGGAVTTSGETDMDPLSRADGEIAQSPARGSSSTPFEPASAGMYHEDGHSSYETSDTHGDSSSFSIGLSVDYDDDDTDSALGSALGGSSMSATSSIYEFVEEFGRTFHRYKEGTLQVLEWKLYLAPLESPSRVLDLGTGTGIWAIEFADQNPGSDVLGTDLSPIQPEYVPANCRFEIDDAEDEWIYSQKFDYIHGRYMCAFLTDFPKLFRNIYDNLVPGGWVEFMETLIFFQSPDGTLEGTPLQRWNELIIEGVKNMGRNVLSCKKYKRWMLETGFDQVTERKYTVPANTWAKGRKNKELGALQMVNNLNGVYGLTMTVLTKGLGWSSEEVEVLLADVRRDMSDKNIHAYITIYVVYGQRPY
ncbi:hypothetical protein PFICI_02207 [Pestalotiopsis fici W106-1]|uniref:Methyltransferase domain-containing protein n=1 Tax=Pestalotiopsis fici (strain W106-1 / CGMCC3.15140) TaxID=1229662 RepID=W3XFH9_PESFW|nr:uncharacterized protein PFICI_02207 [Pestalotiopsis fici W106-1]ETS84182.1 hypothetical protein PFICI_02207 [Pestalotiopsis fici W106-1]